MTLLFDRSLCCGGLQANRSMLVSQAQLEGLTIVSPDRSFAAYDVDVLVC